MAGEDHFFFLGFRFTFALVTLKDATAFLNLSFLLIAYVNKFYVQPLIPETKDSSQKPTFLAKNHRSLDLKSVGLFRQLKTGLTSCRPELQ